MLRSNFQVRYLNLSIANEPCLHLHFDLLSCCVSGGSPAVFPVSFGCNALDEVVFHIPKEGSNIKWNWMKQKTMIQRTWTFIYLPGRWSSSLRTDFETFRVFPGSFRGLLVVFSFHQLDYRDCHDIVLQMWSASHLGIRILCVLESFSEVTESTLSPTIAWTFGKECLCYAGHSGIWHVKPAHHHIHSHRRELLF